MVGFLKWPSETTEYWCFLAAGGATQTACRLLDVDNSELAWTIRAYHGSDVVRDEYEKREPARAFALRFVRGAPGVPDPSG